MQQQTLQQFASSNAKKVEAFQQQMQSLVTTFCSQLREETSTAVQTVDQSTQKNMKSLGDFSDKVSVFTTNMKERTDLHNQASSSQFSSLRKQQTDFVLQVKKKKRVLKFECSNKESN